MELKKYALLFLVLLPAGLSLGVALSFCLRAALLVLVYNGDLEYGRALLLLLMGGP